MDRVKATMDAAGYSFSQMEALASEWNGGKPARISQDFEVFDADVIHNGIEYKGSKWPEKDVVTFLVWEFLRRGQR